MNSEIWSNIFLKTNNKGFKMLAWKAYTKGIYLGHGWDRVHDKIEIRKTEPRPKFLNSLKSVTLSKDKNIYVWHLRNS